MENFTIVMENNLKNSKEEFKKFLDEVFSIYKGKLKLGEDIRGFKNIYSVDLDKSPASIRISYKPSFPSSIKLDTQTHYFSSKIYSKEKVKENFFDFIDLAIAMMKSSNNEFIVGSFEIAETTPKQDVPIQLLFFKEKEWLPYLKEHLKYSLKKEFDLEELKGLTEKNASIFKKYEGFRLICFYPFLEDKITKGYTDSNFYNEVKK